MCADAGAGRIITLTFTQPRVRFVGSDVPGELPDGIGVLLLDGELAAPVADRGDGMKLAELAHVPARHRCTGHRAVAAAACQSCDPATHIQWNLINGGFRWQVLASCPHCCRYVSHSLGKFRQRVRRAGFAGFGYLQAREEHKSGAMHLHLAVIGLPDEWEQRTGSARMRTRLAAARATGRTVKRRRGDAGALTGEAELLTRHWHEAGGDPGQEGAGMIDLGYNAAERPDHRPGDSGFYLGKYLAKQHRGATARGFRRWSKCNNFAPAVRMGWVKPLRHGPVCEAMDGNYTTGACEHQSCQPDWSDPSAPIKLGGWIWPDGTERRGRWWDSMGVPATAPVRLCAARRLDRSTANTPLSPLTAWRVGRVAPVRAPVGGPELGAVPVVAPGLLVLF